MILFKSLPCKETTIFVFTALSIRIFIPINSKCSHYQTRRWAPPFVMDNYQGSINLSGVSNSGDVGHLGASSTTNVLWQPDTNTFLTVTEDVFLLFNFYCGGFEKLTINLSQISHGWFIWDTLDFLGRRKVIYQYAHEVRKRFFFVIYQAATGPFFTVSWFFSGYWYRIKNLKIYGSNLVASILVCLSIKKINYLM